MDVLEPFLNTAAEKEHSYRKYLQAHGKQGAALNIEICHFCPVGCAHCHISSGPKSKLANDDAVIKSSIEEFSRFPDARYVMCTGGEPFAFLKKLRLALNTIKDCGLSSFTLTSGSWARTPRRAEHILATLPFIDLFAVSIDRYHVEKIGIARAINALSAAVNNGYSTFVCIGHMGVDDPFRSEALNALGAELLGKIDVHFYPLLARGSGADLPELEGRELSRSAGQPCFSVGTLLVTANGRVSACCHTNQANRVRSNHPTPLDLGTADDLTRAAKSGIDNPFIYAMRTVGPVEIAAKAGIDVPDNFAAWDICKACEYLQQQDQHSQILSNLSDLLTDQVRLQGLDDLYSAGTARRLRNALGRTIHG